MLNMYPYLLIILRPVLPWREISAHLKIRFSNDFLRPLVPGRAFFDVEGRHHVGGRRDRRRHIRLADQQRRSR